MRGLTIAPLIAAAHGLSCTGDEVFDDSMTICDPTQLQLTVHACAFENARFNDPADAFMAGPDFQNFVASEVNATNTCQPTFADDHYYFSILDTIEDCGTTVDYNTSHVTYSNAVQSTIGSENTIISRVRNMKINFSCVFDLEMTLSVDNAIKPRVEHFEVDMGTTMGMFTVNMGLYTNDQFDSVLAGEVEINVPELLYIGVEIEDETTMFVQLKKCWATPSADSEDPVQYPFIDNYCGDDMELNTYESLVVFTNGESDVAQYSLEAFSFNGVEEGIIYLHCEVRVCDPSAETCTPDCGARKRRHANEEHVVVTSIGPVTVNP